MKKLESSLLNMAVVLTVISVIAGGLLAYVNGVTEGPIQEIKAKALADGIKAVLQADEATVQQVDTIDGGVAVLGMHSPFEVVSKLDCYMTFKAYNAVLRG